MVNLTGRIKQTNFKVKILFWIASFMFSFDIRRFSRVSQRGRMYKRPLCVCWSTAYAHFCDYGFHRSTCRTPKRPRHWPDMTFDCVCFVHLIPLLVTHARWATGQPWHLTEFCKSDPANCHSRKSIQSERGILKSNPMAFVCVCVCVYIYI